MIAGCSLAGVAGSSVAVAVVVIGAGDEVAECFGGTFLADSVGHHPSPLLHFCKWGNATPLAFFWLVWALSWHGELLQLGCSSVLMVGVGVGTGEGRIGQSFHVLNKFSDAKPALGQGVPCLTGALGISSSGEGLSFMDLVVGHGTQQTVPLLVCALSPV